MAAYTRIIVERGAKLVVNGATIKGICNDPWNGIQVWGNTDKNQSAIASNGWPEQGKVELYDATIMDAERAVVAGYTLPAAPDGGISEYDYNGGIIIAENTVFKNNMLSVEMMPYSFDSYSSCQECIFVFDDGCNLNGVDFKNFIHLTGYSEFEINGCDFTNNSTNSKEAEELSNGIYSMDSGLDIDGTCLGEYTVNGCADIKPTTFTNLYYAIFATNVTSQRTISVHHTNFTDNITGIYMNNINYPEIVLNTFEVPDNWGDEDKTGLYFDYCTGYVVQQNEFLSGTTTTKQHGIVVNESGVNENLIYNNSFENINEAIKTQGINHGVFEKEDIGLEIKCNEFFYCNQDIRVHADADGLLTPDDYGIKPIQGYNGILVSDPAGNSFSKYSALPYRDIYNDGIYITYYHHDEESYSPLVPEYFNIDRVDPEPVAGNTYTSSDAACPLKYDPFEIGNQGGSASTESLKSAFDSGTSSAEILSYTLEQAIDGGDTPEMIYDVETSTPPESMILRDELLNKTPYLSDTVISNAIDKEDVLNNTMIYEVMTSNPKSARSQKLIEKLDERQNPMPGYLKAGIINASAITTERDSLEGLLAMHNRERQDAFNRIMIKYSGLLEDTDYLDSISEILHSYRIEEQYQEVLLKYSQNNNEYISVYNNIPIQFQLTSSQMNNYESLGDFIDLLSDYDINTEFTNPDSLFVSDLELFAENHSGWTKLRSMNMLRKVNETAYCEPYFYDNIQKSYVQDDNGNDLLGFFNESIAFYPNPADKYLIIDYISNSDADEILLVIFDLAGKQIRSERLSKAPSSKTVDLQDLTPGVYVFSVLEDGQIKKSEKITILR